MSDNHALNRSGVGRALNGNSIAARLRRSLFENSNLAGDCKIGSCYGIDGDRNRSGRYRFSIRPSPSLSDRRIVCCPNYRWADSLVGIMACFLTSTCEANLAADFPFSTRWLLLFLTSIAIAIAFGRSVRSMHRVLSVDAASNSQYNCVISTDESLLGALNSKKGVEGLENKTKRFNVITYRKDALRYLCSNSMEHDNAVVALLEFESFRKIKVPPPSDAAIGMLAELLNAIRKLPKSAQLQDLLKAIQFIKGNKLERKHILEIFAYSDILCPLAPFLGKYHRLEFCSLPRHPYKAEWNYPACWWTGKAGVNQKAVSIRSSVVSKVNMVGVTALGTSRLPPTATTTSQRILYLSDSTETRMHSASTMASPSAMLGFLKTVDTTPLSGRRAGMPTAKINSAIMPRLSSGL